MHGHTASRCNKAQACGNSSQPDHTSDSCNNDMWCFHCCGPHRVGDAKCPKAIEDKQILTLQDRFKGGRRFALQLFGINDSSVTTSEYFQNMSMG